MSQGILLFDFRTESRNCNQRYIEMYGLSQEIVKPGCSLRDLLNIRTQVGTFLAIPWTTSPA